MMMYINEGTKYSGRQERINSLLRKVICDINKCMRDLFTIKQKVGKISVSLYIKD